MPPDDAPLLFPEPAAPRFDPAAPLADRMRPERIEDVRGQDPLLGSNGPLRRLAEAGELPSLILWGPPGCGKTTLARLLVAAAGLRLEALSAVMAGVKEMRAAVERARRERAQRRTALLLDEIHRLNRAQQDALLPHVESGVVTLVGATTENPSFEVIAPLLSRCRVYTLERLGEDTLAELVRAAAADAERGLAGLPLADGVPEAIAHAADGDARRALSLLEAAAALHRAGTSPDDPLPPERLREAAGHRILTHDRDREEHYNAASAFIKSLRASDPDAALYWALRMLDAGDDPLFVCRRMVVFASEDVGNADPQALVLATSTFLAVERVGLPEGRIPIAQAVTYLACAPKSNASLRALSRAGEAVSEHGPLPVPLHLRNAATPLMKDLGYGRAYAYPHDAPDAFVPAANLPDALDDAVFYEPGEAGAEGEIAVRLRRWRQRRAAAAKPDAADGAARPGLQSGADPVHPARMKDLSIEDRMLLLRFVCSFAWADLQVRPEERDFVRRLVKRLDLSKTERKQVDGWLAHPPAPETVDPAEVPREHRALFLHAAESVIAADGEIAPEEREQLLTLGQLLR